MIHQDLNAQRAELSFVAIEGATRSYWNPARTGRYGLDCNRGKAYAEEMIAYIGRTDDDLIFGDIIRAIGETRLYTGIEVGFCSAIGIRLAAGRGMIIGPPFPVGEMPPLDIAN